MWTHKTQTLWTYPKERTQHLKGDESLKSAINSYTLLLKLLNMGLVNCKV